MVTTDQRLSPPFITAEQWLSLHQIGRFSTNVVDDGPPVELTHIPKSVIEEQLLPSKYDHMFWLKLGRETCNLIRWSRICHMIISEKYGKSDPRAKSLWSFIGAPSHLFGGVQNALDAFLLSSYTEGSKEEHEFLEALREYAGLNHPRGNLVNVFYNISNVESTNFEKAAEERTREYRDRKFVPIRGRKLPKSLSSEEMEYLEQFRERMHQYIQYLKFIQTKTEFFDSIFYGSFANSRRFSSRAPGNPDVRYTMQRDRCQIFAKAIKKIDNAQIRLSRHDFRVDENE